MKKSLLGIMGVDGVAGAGDSFNLTVNVEVVPDSSVWPEVLDVGAVKVKKSLLGIVGVDGVAGNNESSFKATVKVEVVPSSLV